jgi:LPS sulfotransferase NodH
MNNFVIFAHPRSGSTSLARVLGESSDVKMAIEPFHPDYFKWNPKEKNYSKIVKDEQTLNQALEEIFKKYNAIKVLDYQLPEKLYLSLLSRKDLKIILLQRKNLLQAAISNAVGEQTAEWHKTKDESKYDNLKPLDSEKLRNWMEYVGKLSKLYSSYLQKKRKDDFLSLYYEDLYSDSFNDNKDILDKICKYLDIRMPSEKAIRRYMMPSKAKINYKNIYKKIPNYEDIVKKFE